MCYVNSIAVNPKEPSILYACYLVEGQGNPGLYRSVNGGLTWSRVLKAYVSRVQTHSQAGGYVYTVSTTKSNGKSIIAPYISMDGGDHWIIAPFPTDWGSYPTGLACHPTDPRTIYIGGVRRDNGRCFIAKTTDLGTNWTLMSYSGHSYDYAYAIAIDPFNPKRILVGTSRGIYRSENDGQTWTLKGISRYASAIVFDPGTPGAAYLGWENGILRSLDGGKNWQPFNQGLIALYVIGLAVDPAGKILYSASLGGGVCKRNL